MGPESISQLVIFFLIGAYKSIYNKMYNKRMIYKFDFVFMPMRVSLMTTMVI